MIGHNTSLSYRLIPIMVKTCHENAKLPEQADGDVGFDISCVNDVIIQPHSTVKVPTGLMPAETIEPLIIDNVIVALPFMKVEGRSGMASKGVFPVGGIIDPRYRGEIEVVLYNSTSEKVTYAAGSRIAQLVVYYTLANVKPHNVVKFMEAEKVSETDRGSKGFGSSGF